MLDKNFSIGELSHILYGFEEVKKITLTGIQKAVCALISGHFPKRSGVRRGKCRQC